jgi:hypothetical protein
MKIRVPFSTLVFALVRSRRRVDLPHFNKETSFVRTTLAACTMETGTWSELSISPPFAMCSIYKVKAFFADGYEVP